MFQQLNSAAPNCLGDHGLAPRQGGLEALENNPAKIDTLISGNIYIYGLIEQRNLEGSCSVANLLGYRTDDIAVIEPLGLASLIHPDDQSQVTEHFQRFTTLHYEEVIRINYRMQRADGHWCWVRSQETPLVMAIDGFPLQILGIIQVAAQHSSIGRSKLSNRCCR